MTMQDDEWVNWRTVAETNTWKRARAVYGWIRTRRLCGKAVGPGMNASELMAATGLTRGQVYAALGRLEFCGFVERTHANPRRWVAVDDHIEAPRGYGVGATDNYMTVNGRRVMLPKL